MRARVVSIAVAGLLLAAACSQSPSSSKPAGTTTRSSAGQTSGTGSVTTGTPPTSSPSTQPSSTPPKKQRPVTIAFAGDVHFAEWLAARLDHPETALGPLAKALKRADLSIVNLETAVTTRGAPQPKQFVFRAPPVVFTALKDAGVDVATMANNHGLDYGPVSVPDALSAARRANFPVVGIGRNAAQAYRPWIVTVHGQRIAFFGATAVMDAPLIASWSATKTQAGLATALDGRNARLVRAVRAVRPQVDVVVVDLHYGSDLQTCPTEIQRGLVSDLVKAGADVIVGQHAHVLLGAGYDGSAYVDYGMGNFQFYVSGGPQAETGVLQVTVKGRRVTAPTWIPGRIVSGVPVRLTGEEASAAQQRWEALRPCTGLTSEPR